MGWSGRAQKTRPASTVHRRPAGSHAAISATSCRTAPVPAWTSPAQGAPAGGRAARGGAARAAARLRAAAPIPLLLCAPIRDAPRRAAADAAAGASLLPAPTQAPGHTRTHHQSPPPPTASVAPPPAAGVVHRGRGRRRAQGAHRDEERELPELLPLPRLAIGRFVYFVDPAVVCKNRWQAPCKPLGRKGWSGR